jgi:hypothetical protein
MFTTIILLRTPDFYCAPSPRSEISASAADYFDFWSNIYLKLKEKHLPQIVSGACDISLQMFTIL